MPSAALMDWTTVRAQRLDELLAAHSAIAGTGRGRRWRTKQINWSLSLRLAAEFQGFARDLHDLTGDALVDNIPNSVLATVVASRFTESRQLDRGNATPGNIGSDFQKLGLLLWPALHQKYPQAPKWNKTLEHLCDARNAIAHADDNKLLKAAANGYDANTLQSFRGARSQIDRLAHAMDEVVSTYIGAVLAAPKPW